MPNDQADLCCAMIMNAMSCNETLRSFRKYKKAKTNVTLATRKSQNRMIQQNTSLVNFELFREANNDLTREIFCLS
jgi:hypothetical protein